MRFLPLNARAKPRSRQLVATIGPRSLPLVRDLAGVGATAFRLNASHMNPDGLRDSISAISAACPGAPVVVDLQGAKMRLGHIARRPVSRGERLRFSVGAASDLPLPHPEIYAQAQPGQTLTIDDGRMRLSIERVADSTLEAAAVTAGTLEPRKGVNVEEHPIRLARLTDADAEAVDVAAAAGVRVFAFSFMTSGEEAGWVRERTPGAMVIGKVERQEAASALESIVSATDAAWICRGDLGAQLGPAGLARFVAAVDPRRLPAPILMAGQVLQHLVEHLEPTRSEVCHLHDLLARGFAGIVLSDETVVGTDPVNAVRVASELMSQLG